MKKIFSIFIILLIAFNIGGYYFVFKMIQHDIKREAKAFFKKNINKLEFTETIKISTNIEQQKEMGFEKVESNEFTINGNMYDIVSQEFSNGFIIYKCVNDKKENKLIRTFEKLADATNSSSSTRKHRTQNLLKILVKEIIPNQLQKNVTYIGIEATLIINSKQLFTQCCLLVNTPPPKV